MPALKLQEFGGMLPAWDAHLLPTGQASFAKNGYLFSGALTGWRLPKRLRDLNSSTARSVYRIPTVSKTQARAYLVFLTQPNDGDTIVVGELTYRFVTALELFIIAELGTTTHGRPFDVVIGTSPALTARNLGQALTADSEKGTNAGVNYGDGTAANTAVKFFLPDTDPIVGLTDPRPGVEVIGGTDYSYLVVGASDFGASFNLVKVSTVAPTRVLWVYSLASLLNTTMSFAGGTNPTFDNRITGSAFWLEFDDPDTNVFKSPIVDDQWNRYYTASPSDMPKYNTYDRIVASNPFWLLGVPPPGCAASLEVTGGGNTLQLGNVTASGGLIQGLPNRIYTTKITTPGDTQIQRINFTADAARGFPADGYPTAHWAGLIFVDDNGKPGNLLNTGKIVTGIDANGPQISVFVNPTSLSGNTSYWIGIMLDTAIPLAGGPAGGSLSTDSWSNTFTNGPPATAPNTVNARTALTSDGTNVANGDVVQVGLNTYQFQTTLSPAGGSSNVHIGANADASLANLSHAINASGGTPGVDYGSATAHNAFCNAGPVISHAIEITAKSQDIPFDIVETRFLPVGTPPHLTFDGPTLEPGFETNQLGLNIWADLATTDVIEARAYVYTWVSEYGEEGPPSPPTILDGWSNGVWTVGLWKPPPDDLGVLRNLKKINIYRTVPGQGGQTVFFFVDSIDIGALAFVDGNPNNTVALNNQLASTNWFPPPENLQGFTVLQNGMVAAFTGNEIWFCEPYHPHAWPPGYVLTVDFPIVGMGVTNGALIVCTAANPYVITGNAPNQMSQTKCADANPCSSRASILSGDGAVSFTSHNGLIQVTAAGQATNTTDLWFTREKWAQLTPQHDARAIFLASSYFCLGAVSRDLMDNSEAQRGFTIELDQDNTSFTIWPQPGGHRLGFEIMDTPTGKDIKGVLTDPWTGIGLLVSDGSVWYYDFLDPAPVMQVYTWRSKAYQQNARRSYSAMKVFFNVEPGTPALNATRLEAVASDPAWSSLPADRWGYIKTYVDIAGDGNLNLIDCRELRKPGELLRIVDGYKADTFQWEIVARVPISNVQIATSLKELAQV